MTPEQERLLIATADGVGSLLALLAPSRGEAGEIANKKIGEIADSIISALDALEGKGTDK